MEPQRTVEQIEVIEHTVTEGRRPISSEALNYLPPTEYRTTSENIVTTTTSGALFEGDRRFQLTGERDFSREPSFLHHSAGKLRDLPLTHSTPEKHSSSGINNYGYDVHEVHTSEGGARIVQSHGSGFVDASPLQHSSMLMHDRSLDTTLHNQSGAKRANISHTNSEQLHSILKTTEEWRRNPSDENSFTRKDSYRRMQENQMENSLYAPSSNATMITKNSKDKWNFGISRGKGNEQGCWASTKAFFNNLATQIRESQWDRKTICSILAFLLCLFLLVFILWLIFNSIFTPYSLRTLLLYPPVCEECLKRNPAASTYRAPSKVYVHFASPAQAHFETVGNPPLKSNSFIAVDFDTGYIAIADHALTNKNGQHTTCFLMDLDRNALPSMDVLRDGLKESYDNVKTQFGWQEYWQYVPEHIDEGRALSKFTDSIPDCRNVKWYYLKHTVYTRDENCDDCYDFCLPDYAVQRRQKYEDELTIGIRRLNCFRFYVPEWSKFSIKPDELGGHWEYPLNPSQTARDADGNWVSWAPTAYLQRTPDQINTN